MEKMASEARFVIFVDIEHIRIGLSLMGKLRRAQRSSNRREIVDEISFFFFCSDEFDGFGDSGLVSLLKSQKF